MWIVENVFNSRLIFFVIALMILNILPKKL